MSEDEWTTLPEVAAEIGTDPAALPPVTRRAIPVAGEQEISALVWGSGKPELVFLHGGGQNAHTWDLVAVGLGRAAIALDLPGHGHSSWRADQDYTPVRNAEAIAAAVATLVAEPTPVVGMSLGGLTAIRLAATRPELVSRLLVVDVTPGVLARTARMTTEQRGTTALVGGPEYFATREEMIERAVRASPRRPAAAVRRGVVHNTMQTADGRWRWRYDTAGLRAGGSGDHSALWRDVSALRMPVTLVRGGESAFVGDEDVAEFRRSCPHLREEVVPGAGHAVQSDQPARLAEIIRTFTA